MLLPTISIAFWLVPRLVRPALSALSSPPISHLPGEELAAALMAQGVPLGAVGEGRYLPAEKLHRLAHPAESGPEEIGVAPVFGPHRLGQRLLLGVQPVGGRQTGQQLLLLLGD